MFLYQLTKDGEPFGEPMPEWLADKIIKRTQISISNELDKSIVKPELKVIGGQAYANNSSERIPANA